MKACRSIWLGLLGVMLVTTCQGVLAAEIPPVPELKTFYTEVAIAHGAAPKCLVVVPPGDVYREVGAKLAAAIKKVSGADVPVQSASTTRVDTLKNSNAILVGYFANNPLVERVYDEHYVCLDKGWPGDGAYVVRTVHDPLGAGTSFVYIGGADSASVNAAADDFIGTLPEKGDVSYPHTVKVVLPGDASAYQSKPETIQSRIDGAKGKNFRATAAALNGAAVRYYLSGNPDEVEVFKGIVPILAEIVSTMKEVGDARGAFDLFNTWDNIEEAPGFTEEDRRKITTFLWEFANKFHYAGKAPEKLTRPVGNCWNSRVAWDIARYFNKYYDLDVAGLWAWANARFQGKAKFWRSNEDCPGYGGMTTYDTFYYALSARHDRWFDSGLARKACDYGMAVTNNLGGHAGFGDTGSMYGSGYWSNLFLVSAWRYKDGRFLWAYNRTPGHNRAHFGYNSYVQDTVEPKLPEDMLGVHVVPLPDWVYEGRTQVLGTAPSQMNPMLDADPAPPREECFDKITFRTSFEREDQYLILGGVSHGYHAHPDGNSIIEYTDKDAYRIFDHGYFVPDTPEHNTLVVYRDGMFEPVPRLTGLAHLGDFAQIGVTQTYLNGYNGVDWRRNVIWNKEEYFLVIDEVEAVEDGNFGMNVIYRVLSDQEPRVGADRVSAVHRGRPLNLISASQAPLRLTTTTPYSRNRHAIIESKSAKMAAGDKQYFANLFHTGDKEGEWPYEIVPAGKGVVMIKSPGGYALAGVGEAQPLPGTVIDAAVFYVEPHGFALTGGRTIATERTWFASDKPLNIEVDLRTGSGSIEAKGDTVVRLHPRGEGLKLDGKAVKPRSGPHGIEFDVAAGKHSLSFTPAASKLDVGSWRDAYASFQEQHNQALATPAGQMAEGKQMSAAWREETYKTDVVTYPANADGERVNDLTRTGEAKAWTEAQGGCGPQSAVDGNPDSYSAVGSGSPHSGDLPKDLGMEWPAAVSVGCFQIDYYNRAYAPADDGHQLQAWDGKDWYAIEAQVTKDESGANWVYAFDAVETSRVRVFITKFNPTRTAVREMRIFPEPAALRQEEVKIPLGTNSLAGMDVDGDGNDEVLAAVDKFVKCLEHDGTLAWQQELPDVAMAIDAHDLDKDGKGEVVVGCRDHKLYCFDFDGNQRWSVPTPADSYFPEVEPATGQVKQVRCADMDGDGDGEIVIGSSNWFAYGYDHTGENLWKALNWAHQPTSIAFAKMGEGRLAALIGTTYNSANVFSPEGRQIHSVSAGYHGAAMSAAAGDMDGNAKDELLVGSRVGGFHCNELGTNKSWARFMGAEVSRVAAADLTGDGELEAIAASKNAHLLVTDAGGEVLWAKNVGQAILDLAVADVNGDGKAEIIVATEGGMVRVVDAKGSIVGTMKTERNVTNLIATDLNGDGKAQIVAGCDDGFVYGDIR